MADSKEHLSGTNPLLEDPNLPKGWTRKVTQRKGGKSAGKYDVYLFSPDGTKFRSQKELENYIKQNTLSLKAADLDFTVSGKDNVLPRSAKKVDKETPAKVTPKITKKTPVGKKQSLKIKMEFSQKKRGRPRKVRPEEEEDKNEANEVAEQAADSASEAQNADSVEAVGEATKTEEPLKIEKSTEEQRETEPEEKPVKKRGRPSKASLADTPVLGKRIRKSTAKVAEKEEEEKEKHVKKVVHPKSVKSQPIVKPKKVKDVEKKVTKKKESKKIKPKKQPEPVDPEEERNAQIMAEIEAELAEMRNRRTALKRKASTSAERPPSVSQPSPSKVSPSPKRKRKPSRMDNDAALTALESPTAKVEPPVADVEVDKPSPPKKKRRSKVDAVLSESQAMIAKPDASKESKKWPGKKAKGGVRGRQKAKPSAAEINLSSDLDAGTFPYEGESLGSLEAALKSAASLLENSDSENEEGEEALVEHSESTPPVLPKQSRSGRNVRSPRRPMEGDFETNFAVLKKAMNATTEMPRRRRPSATAKAPKVQTHLYDDPLDFWQGDTARTRTFDENVKEKRMFGLEPEDMMLPPPIHRKQGKKPGRAPEVPKIKHKREPKPQNKVHKAYRIPNPKTEDVYHHPPSSSAVGHHLSKDLLELEMTPPPCHPIIPADDHNYSLSSRYFADPSAPCHHIEAEGEDELFFTPVGNRASAVANSSLQFYTGNGDNSASAALATFGEDNAFTISSSSAITVGSTGEDGSSNPPKQILIYMGDRPTVVPITQDESGMSVITLPNGLSERIQS